MKPRQRERATEIFHAALEMPEPERSGFLHDACGSDLTLRSEVEGLLVADAGAGSSFLNPVRLHAAPQPELILTSGDIISGRFKIMRPLGDGGMGRVYEAYDSVLGVKMALKTLRQEISSTPDILARFRQEVRIAHRITHTNICRTYHLDRDLRDSPGATPIELTFLTMEYLEGETLQQLLRRRGGLPLDHALEIARQLTEAIDAAHAVGAIHRDIKPANVMICASAGSDNPRVVIMDFGLAKLTRDTNSADVSSISQPGQAMGTLAYMSPEQLRGVPAENTTDIYAFGLVLYEMITGVKAFPDCNTFQDAYRRVHQPPPSPRKILPSVPSAWDTAISCCLQIHPATRSQTAHDVLHTIEGSPATRAWTRTRRHLRHALLASPRRKLAIAAAFVLIMSLSAAAFRFMRLRSTETDAAVAPGTLVYLAPVSNRTGEKQLDSITQLVEAGLSQSAHINLLDAGRVGDMLQQMARKPDTTIDVPTAREIAMRAGAARVIFPVITGTAPNYQLSIDIQQPDNDPSRYREHWPRTWQWQSHATPESPSTIPQSLQDTLRKASDWTRHIVGESQNDIARLDVLPADVTTASWAALADYTHATELESAGDASAAVLAMKTATQADPGFALAYARLGDMDFALQRNEEGLDAYAKALATGADRRLSRRERDRIKAMVAIDTGDYQSADDALRDSISFYENDPVSWAYRVDPLKKLGRPEEAITSLNKMLQLNPRSRFGLTELANTYMFMGRNDEAAKAIDRIRALGLYPDSITELEGHLQFLQGRDTDAEQSFRSLIHAKDTEVRLRAGRALAYVYAERGNYNDALVVLNQAVASADVMARQGVHAMVLLDRAEIQSKLGHTEAMLLDIHQGVTLDSSTHNLIAAVNTLGRNFSVKSFSSTSAIRDALRTMLSTLPENSAAIDAQFVRLRIQEELALRSNNWKGALEFARKAATIDAPAGQREYVARALTRAALQKNGPGIAKQLRDEAAQAYSIVALHPGIVWSHPTALPPGTYSDQLKSYLEVSTNIPLPPQAFQPRDDAHDVQHGPHLTK